MPLNIEFPLMRKNRFKEIIFLSVCRFLLFLLQRSANRANTQGLYHFIGARNTRRPDRILYGFPFVFLRPKKMACHSIFSDLTSKINTRARKTLTLIFA